LINYEELADSVREFCKVILKEDRYFLRIMHYMDPLDEDDAQMPDASQSPLLKQNYQAAHSVRSLILSVIMGDYLKFDENQLIELAIAAMLHELGMLHIPPASYLTDKPLTREERKSILTHPILGFNILRSLNFPQTIRLAVLEHHERGNGSGYPQRLTGDKISLYAKIIAVACSFEAITSARPYKSAKDGHMGILDLLKNEGGRYDEKAIRALICSVSLYPIGCYVLLSDGRKAQVVDVNPSQPRYPLIHILGDRGAEPTQTSPAGLSIQRLLAETER
jgi:HD-GYP domain-containing protein (c-di-GMP phosphodiesterase class II)